MTKTMSDKLHLIMVMKENIITKERLEPFVLKDDPREILNKVFRQNGYVVASDGHILIRVPEGRVKDADHIPVQDLPHINSILPSETPLDIPLTKSLIKKKIEEAPTVADKLKCKDCEGSGKVEWYYDDKEGCQHTDTFKCPVCKGKGYVSETGRMIPDPRQLFSLADGLMDAECLDNIVKVMDVFKVTKVCIRASDEYKIMFTIGDIQVLKTYIMKSGEELCSGSVIRIK